MNKKKDWLIVAALLVAALVLYAVSGWMPKEDLSQKTADVTLAPDAIEYVTPEPTVEPTAEPTAEVTAEPTAEPTTEVTAEPTAEPAAEPTAEPATEVAAAGPMPRPQTQEVRGYVVLTVNGRQYGDPIPMDRDKIITLKQDDGKVNKVHITPEKVYMESSTCDNQDCVGQGEITLDNYEKRVLSTYIVCLPNSVTIEFFPAEE